MIKLLAILRNLVWPSILSILCIALAILLALVSPSSLPLILSLSSASIALAILAQRS
jgi:hypothetical protein